MPRRRAILLLLGGGATAFAGPRGREVLVTGRAVCVESGEPAPPETCSFGEAFAIRSGDGSLHLLDPADPRVEILTDARVHAHPLEVTLWQEDGLGKIIHLHTVQDGEVIEPFYFCFTCNITSHLPGPCWCCQEEFEFRERPANRATGGATGSPPGA